MPGFDDAEIELTLEKYHTRNPDDDSVEERWRVDAPGLGIPCGGETPSRALEVLAESLRDDDNGQANLNELIEAEPDDDAVECDKCGSKVSREEAIKEVNAFGDGSDERHFCGLECSMSFAGGDD